MIELAYSLVRDLLQGLTLSLPASVLWLVLIALFGSSLTWVLQSGSFVRRLRAQHPVEHSALLAPLTWSWSLSFNPVAIVRLFAFIALRRDAALGDPTRQRIGGRLRVTLAVLAIGWPLFILLLALAGSESLANAVSAG